jgi:RNA polymerase sigma factor (sigma-70 family)
MGYEAISVDLPWSRQTRSRTAVAALGSGQIVLVNQSLEGEALPDWIVSHAAPGALVVLDVPIEGCGHLSRAVPRRQLDDGLARVGMPILPSYASGELGAELRAGIAGVRPVHPREPEERRTGRFRALGVSDRAGIHTRAVRGEHARRMARPCGSRASQSSRGVLGGDGRTRGQRSPGQDFLQAAFVRGIEKSGSIRDAESAVAWFYRLLRNAVVDHYRRSGTARRVFSPESGDDTGANEAETRGEICACIRSLLPALKAEYAEMVQRVDLDEEPLAAAAAALDITTNNATVRLHRARAALRKQLQRSCGTCATHGCLDCGCGGSRRSRLPSSRFRGDRASRRRAPG